MNRNTEYIECQENRKYFADFEKKTLDSTHTARFDLFGKHYENVMKCLIIVI